MWGFANTLPTLGNIVGIGALVLLVGRVRSTVLALMALGVVLLAVPLTAAAISLTGLALGLITWALAAFVMAVPMGAMALEVQRRYRRPIMGSFDACFGAGVMAGGATGTVSAALDVRPVVQLAVTSGLLALALTAVAPWLPEESLHRGGTRQASPWRRLDRRVLTIAAMAFLSAYVTEASVLWSAIYVADTMSGGQVLGGLAYTAATMAGTLALLLVDRATAGLGSLRFLRMSTLFAAAGFGTCLAIANPWAAIVGFVLLSAGMACVNPIVYTMAGSHQGLTASEGVSVVEIAQTPGAAIAAPALIGALSSVVGLRIALGSIALAALLLALLARSGAEPARSRPRV